MKSAIQKARLGREEELQAIARLDRYRNASGGSPTAEIRLEMQSVGG